MFSLTLAYSGPNCCRIIEHENLACNTASTGNRETEANFTSMSIVYSLHRTVPPLVPDLESAVNPSLPRRPISRLYCPGPAWARIVSRHWSAPRLFCFRDPSSPTGAAAAEFPRQKSHPRVGVCNGAKISWKKNNLKTMK